MIICCPECSARYKIPSHKVKGRGAKIACPKCKHRFVVLKDQEDPPEDAEAAPAGEEHAAADDVPADIRGRDFTVVGVNWRIRKGLGYYDVSTLQELLDYMEEGQINQWDKISYDNRTFLSIEECGNLDAYFWNIYQEAEQGKITVHYLEDDEDDDEEDESDAPTTIVGHGSSLARDILRALQDSPDPAEERVAAPSAAEGTDDPLPQYAGRYQSRERDVHDLDDEEIYDDASYDDEEVYDDGSYDEDSYDPQAVFADDDDDDDDGYDKTELYKDLIADTVPVEADDDTAAAPLNAEASAADAAIVAPVPQSGAQQAPVKSTPKAKVATPTAPAKKEEEQSSGVPLLLMACLAVVIVAGGSYVMFQNEPAPPPTTTPSPEPVAEVVPEPADPAMELIEFKEPVKYTVRKGDTLARIVTTNGCTEEDILAWNSLTTKEIEVGQELWIFQVPLMVTLDPVADAEPDEADAQDGSADVAAAADDADANADAAPTEEAGTAEADGPADEGSGDAVAAADADAAGKEETEGGEDEAEKDTDKPGAFSLRNAGALGALDGLDSLGGGLNADAIRGDREKFKASSGGLGAVSADRAGGGGTIERSGQIERRQFVASTQQTVGIPDKPVTAPSLPMPAAKRCLKGPSEAGDGDYSYDAGVGLNAGQIRGTLGPFVSKLNRCIPSGASGTVTVNAELLVGCDGRVKNAYVSGPAPDGVIACLEKTLTYAGFPAHDLPDGASFVYPITFRFSR